MTMIERLGLALWVGMMAVSAAATASPPAPPGAAVVSGMRAFTFAITAKNIGAYESVLATNVKITVETGKPVPRQAWMNLISQEFSNPDRRVSIRNILAGTGAAYGFERVTFVEQISECPPVISECLPFWQTETLTFDDAGKVASLDRSVRYLFDLWPWMTRNRFDQAPPPASR